MKCLNIIYSPSHTEKENCYWIHFSKDKVVHRFICIPVIQLTNAFQSSTTGDVPKYIVMERQMLL